MVISSARAGSAAVGTAQVRQVPAINGGATVEGSVHMMTGGSVNLNGGATITGDLLVPGLPTVRLNGNPVYAGTVDGTGATTPSNYTITLNGNASLGHVVRRTVPVALPAVPVPPASAGTRSVTLNQAGQSPAPWSTLRNLALNSNVGQVVVPPGTYGEFTANGGTGFTFGTAGATQPSVYNFQRFTLNGQSQIQVLGPVVINLANGFSANGQVGSTEQSGWLVLNIASGGFTLNGGSSLYGILNAPAGTVIINGNSRLVGGLTADSLIVNGGGLLRLQAGGGGEPANTAPVAVGQNLSTPEDSALALVLSATDAEGDALTYTVVTPPAHGSLGGAAPNLTYTPAADYHGPDAFTFRANDGQVDSAIATVSLTVTPVNDAPVAASQTVSTAEDTPRALILAGTDRDGDALTYTVSTPPAHGTLGGTAPALTYIPATDYHGPDAFAFTVSDGSLVSAPVTVSIEVTPVNDAPVAQSAAYSVDEGRTLPLVLAATDVDGDALTYAIATTPALGSLSGTPPNLVYTPPANTEALVEFTFTASDSLAVSAPATVVIAVHNLPDAPQAHSQSGVLAEDTQLALTLAATDPDGDALTYEVVVPPAYGMLSGVPPALTYTPDPNYHGPDSFTFIARDAALVSAPATVSLTVTPVNDAPVATSHSLTTAEDTALGFTLAGTDADGDALVFTVTTPPAHGTLHGTAPNLSYEPAADYHGPDSFAFTVSDGQLVSAPATIALAITPVNDAPIAAPRVLQTDEDTALPLTLAATDADGDTLGYAVFSPPAHGTLTGDASDLVYTPAADYHGSDEFTYLATDATDSSAPAVVRIQVVPVNDAPVAHSQNLAVNEGASLALDLIASDADGDDLSYTLLGLPDKGTLVPAPGSSPGGLHFIYTPPANFSGVTNFAFQVSDGLAQSASATIEITVTNLNDAPVATAAAVELAEDNAFAFDLPAADPDGDALHYVVVTPPAHGAVTLDGSRATYTPQENFHGTDQFTFTADDGVLLSLPATITLTVTPVNDIPVAAPLALRTDEDTPVTLTLSGTDADGDALAYEIVASPTRGTLSGIPPSLTYTSAQDAHGADFFTYVTRDGTTASAPVVVSIEVTSVNDRPVALPQSLAVAEGDTLRVTPFASDVEGDALTYAIAAPPAIGTLVPAPDSTPAAPAWLYTPPANTTATTTFAFIASDATLTSLPATVTIAVSNRNDPPVAAPAAAALDEDGTTVIALSATDPDGDALTYVIATPPGHGTVSLAGHLATYTPAADYHGSDVFAFVASDNGEPPLASAPASVSLVVRPVNDAPVAVPPTGLQTLEDTPLALTLAGTDVDGDPLTYSYTAPSHGTLSGTAPALTYTPAADYHGPDTFTYTVADPSGAVSAIATVSLVVTPVNDAPVAQAQTFTLAEDTSLSLTLAATDPDNDALTYTVSVAPAHGTLTGTAPALVYTPAANFSGTDTFTFVARDAALESAPAVVSLVVTPVNDAPRAVGQSLSTPEDTALPLTLAGTDDDGDALSYTLTALPTHGILTLAGGGSLSPVGSSLPASALRYTPAGDYHGTDAFAFTASDGVTSSDPASIAITVTSVNDAPVAQAQAITVAANGSVTLTLAASDADGDALAYAVAQPPAHGTLSGTAPSLVYAPDYGYSGADAFTFTASDGAATSLPKTVSVTVTPPVGNQAPIVTLESPAAPQPFTAFELVAVARDADGQVAKVEYFANGTSLGTALAPVAGDPTRYALLVTHGLAAGTYTFTARVTDNEGASALSAPVALTIAYDPRAHTFTSTADFAAGALDHLKSENDELTTGFFPAAFDYVWVANSTAGTVVRIDAETGRVVGEYRTAPAGSASFPSSIAVDSEGSVWVANRATNSIVKIGLGLDNGRWVDRNFDGVPTTSQGQGDILAWPAGGQPADEHILLQVQTSAVGLDHVAVDANNNVWVGGYSGKWQLLDGKTGTVLREEFHAGVGGRGGFIDAAGVQVSTGYHFMRWNTAHPAAEYDPVFAENVREKGWGVARDAGGNYWVTQDWSSFVEKYSASGEKLGSYPTGSQWGQGIVIDGDGHIWIAHSHCGDTVGHLLPDGTWVGNVKVAAHGPTEVSVDRHGRIWVVSTTGVVERINPLGGPLGRDGVTPVGEVDLRSAQLGGTLWTYGKFVGNGQTLRLEDGSWIFDHDSGIPGASWGPVAWNAILANDAAVRVEVASSEDGQAYGPWETLTLESPVPAGTGRHLRGRVSLAPATTGESPVLFDLTVGTTGYQAPAVPHRWYVRAGEDQSANWPDKVQLKGATWHSAHAWAETPSYQWTFVGFTPLATGGGTAPVGGTVVFTDPANPRSQATFSGVGDYRLRLTATLHGISSSDEVTVRLTPYNKLPYVSANSHLFLRDYTETAILDGVARDDGLPIGGAFVTTWEKAFGPGNVTFADSHSAVTTATFSAPGLYVLRLRGNDGELQSASVMSVYAGLVCSEPPPRGLISWWQANGGGADHISGNQAFPEQGANFADGYVGPAFNFDGIDDRFLVFGNDTMDVGARTGFGLEFWVRPAESRQSTLLEYGRNATTVGLSVRQVNTTLEVNFKDTSGTSHVISLAGALPAGAWTHLGINYDRATGWAYFYRNGAWLYAQQIGSFALQTSYDFRLGTNWAGDRFFKGLLDEVSLYDRALSFAETWRIYADGQAGKQRPVTNAAPVIDAGGDYLALSAPATLALRGNVTDDGLPAYQTVHSRWTVLAKPSAATVNFAADTNPATTATFSQAGLYTLQLEADDGAFCARKTVEVRIAQGASAELPSSLVAWWPGNHSNREVVRNREEVGVNVAYAAGNVGEAYSFDGTNRHVFVAETAGQTNIGSFATGFTLEAWIWRQGADYNNRRLLSWSRGTSEQSFLMQYDTVAYLYGVDSTLWIPLTNGGWTHIAYTYDRVNQRVRAYQNGVVLKDAAVSASLAATWASCFGGDLYFGGLPFQTAATWSTARLDELSFHNRPLTSPELVAIYNAGGQGKLPPSTNQAPVVSAGPDQTIYASTGSFVLQGQVSDDGLPVNQLTIQWTQAGGPATATLATPTSAQTNATFPAPGIYSFKLTATDGQITREDVVEVRVGQGAMAEIPSGLVGWWSGDYANREEIRNKTETGANVAYAAGVVGGAYSFDGTNRHVFVAETAGQTDIGSFPAGFTLEAWVWRQGTDTSNRRLLAWSRGSSEQSFVMQYSGNVYLYGVSNAMWVPLTNSAWTHVAYTYDRATQRVRCYQNGVVFKDEAVSASLATTWASCFGGDLYFGGLPYHTAANWSTARLDELCFYNRPLTETELAAIYNAGSQGKLPPSTNQAPVVSAGPDQTIYASTGSLVLQGQVADDGLPANQLSVQWTQVSGPATATLATPALAQTSATFPAAGIYSFKLTATDGLITRDDVVEVRVGQGAMAEPPSGLVAWWPGNQSNREAVTGRAESGVNVAYTTGAVGGAYSFDGTNRHVFVADTPGRTDLGTFAAGFTVEFWAKASTTDYGDRKLVSWAGPGVLRGTIDSMAGGSGLVYLQAGATSWSISNTNPASGWIHLAWSYDNAGARMRGYRNGVLQLEATVTTTQAATLAAMLRGDVHFGGPPFLPSGEWANGGLDEVAFYNRPLSQGELVAIYNAGAQGKLPASANQAPMVTAGPDQTVAAAGGNTVLQGLVADDGLPANQLTIQWTQVSGPATATLVAPASAQTSATFPAAGVYGFKLTATDGLITREDTMDVRVAASSAVAPPSGLVAWWPGNQANRETVMNREEAGVSLAYTQGKVGGAYNFDGTNRRVFIPEVPGQTDIGAFSNGFTVELWMKSSSTDYANRRLVGWASGTTSRGGINSAAGGGGLAYLQDNANTNWLIGSTGPGFGWVHVAWAYDKPGARMRSYRNGVLQQTADVTPTQATNLATMLRGDLYFGGYPLWINTGNNTEWANGGLDELAFYNRPLSATEISAIYTASAFGKQPLSVPNSAPQIQLVAPLDGAALRTGDPLTFTASAIDREGTPASVAFYDGAALLGTVTAPVAPGSATFTFTYAAGLSFGSHTITAVVTDAGGLSVTSAPVTVAVAYGPPSVALVAPASGATVPALLPLTLRASASYGAGPLAKVEFFDGAAKIGESTVPDSGSGDYSLSVSAGLAVGAHSLTARAVATDGASRVSSAVSITAAFVTPVVALTSPTDGSSFLADRSLTLRANATVATGSIGRVEFYRGTTLLGTVATPDPASTSTFNLNLAAGLPAGSHALTARAVAAQSGATATSSSVNVTAAPYTGPEAVEITTPAEDARVSAPVSVTGLVALNALASWKLEYRLTPADPAASEAAAPWATLANGNDFVGTPAVGSASAVPGTLGTLDPTLLLNGLYQLRLAATTTGGVTHLAGPVSVLVEGNMKVGAFSVAFNDLVESTAGLPITLTRTYDSRDRRAGDFGPGWNLALGNIRVQKNRHLGNGWWQTPPSGELGLQSYFLEPIDQRLVTIVMPDGATHRFRAGAYVKTRTFDDDNESFPDPAREGSYRFYPVGDTTSTLEPITLAAAGEPVLADRFWLEGTGDQDLYVGHYGDGLETGFPVPYNPSLFRLTTADGTVMLLDQALGLLELRDRNGNRLVVRRHPASAGTALAGRIQAIDSIQNAEGGAITRSVTVHRLADGRVDYITDLAGRTLDYLYDPQGRLASFTDREDNTTQFRYEKSDLPAHPLFHYLTKIIDPRGLPALRCEYDDAGRLRKQIDADGRETVFDRGIDVGSGRYERITDRLGHPTTYFYDERGNVTSKRDALGAVTTYAYYADGDRVKFEEDHYGNVKAFAYDARGNVTVEILGASRSEEPAAATTGFITRTTYTGFSAPLSLTDSDGRVQSFTYDPATQQLLTHTVGQLAAGASSEIEAATPATTTYTYHADGTLWTVTDALGNVTTTTYDYGWSDAAYPGAVKRVTTTVVDPAGAAGSDPANAAATTLRTTYSYNDAQDNLLATVTPRTLADGTVESAPTRHVYDTENRLRFTLLPDGRIQETRYTSFGQTDKTLDWPVGTNLATLVAAGPSGPTAGARVTAMSYDARGNIERTTLADGTFTATGYDLEGRPVWRQDARGYRTFTVYDELGRQRYTIAPDADDRTFDAAPSAVDDARLANNPRSETIYDLTGRVRFQIDEEGATIESRYFADGTPQAGRREKLVQHLDGTELVTTYAYYPSGQVRSVTDPRNNTVGTRYDSHGRPVRTLLPATDENPATETRTTYNVLGQRIAVTDQEGKVTRQRHDALGRLVEVRQYLDQSLAASDSNFNLPASSPNVISTTFGHDDAGNQTAQTDARGNTTRYEHDALGRRLKRILPATTGQPAFEQLRYDVWGDLWQRDDFAGRTTTFGYDELHRLRSKQADPAHPSLVHSHAIARVEYDYDDNGAREAARTYNASGTLLYTETTPRDERGRIDYKDTGAGGARLDYEYYANGLLKDTVSSTPGGVNVGYRYDALNRLAFVDDATNGLPVRTSAYVYNAAGSLEAVTYANGLRHAYRYDSLNRLRYIDVGQAGGLAASGIATYFQSYEYKLRASGHRREALEGAAPSALVRTAAYAYDDLYRLTGETITGDTQHSGTVTYGLDKVGNRESRTSSVLSVPSVVNPVFNPRDQLSTDTYDTNGNTLSSPLASAPDEYDFEDRLIVRHRADGSTVNLNYDGGGLRTRKTILNGTAQLVSSTSYLVCTNNLTGYAQVLEETTTEATETTLKAYTYGKDLLSVAESSPSISSFNTRCYVYDGGGNVRALADETGIITDRYTFDAFGVLLEHAGTNDNAYLYRGEQWDPDLGLYYLRARFMNPDSGRFWNQDTYEGHTSDPASLHKYLYAHADPVSNIDPSGHLTLNEYAIIGSYVHGVIGIDFVAGELVPGSRYHNYTSIQAIMEDVVSLLDEDDGALRPDLVDTFTKEAYEIKPERSLRAARKQLQRYIDIFDDAGETYNPGTSYISPPSPIPIPMFPDYIVTTRYAEPGVILYKLSKRQPLPQPSYVYSYAVVPDGQREFGRIATQTVSVATAGVAVAIAADILLSASMRVAF